MDERLTNILEQIKDMVSEIQTKYEGKEIYSSTSGEKKGKVAIYGKEISPGIRVRFVNDASYTVGGSANKEQLKADLEQIASSSDFMSLPLGVRNLIFNLYDAVEMAIQQPDRDAGIIDRDETENETETPLKEISSPDIELLKEMHTVIKSIYESYVSKTTDVEKDKSDKQASIDKLLNDISDTEEVLINLQTQLQKGEITEQEYAQRVSAKLAEYIARYEALIKNTNLGALDTEVEETSEKFFNDKVRPRVQQLSEKSNKRELSGKEKKLSIVFDATKGTYSVFRKGDEKPIYEKLVKKQSNKTLTSLKAEVRDMLKLMKAAKKTTTVDLYLYQMLKTYDSNVNTNFATEYLRAIAYDDKTRMPINLKYKMDRKNTPIDEQRYGDIEYWADRADRKGIAIVEGLEDERRFKDEDPKGIGDWLKWLADKAMDFGANVLLGIGNIAHNVKDVISGRKRAAILLPPAIWQGKRTKLFGRPVGKILLLGDGAEEKYKPIPKEIEEESTVAETEEPEAVEAEEPAADEGKGKENGVVVQAAQTEEGAVVQTEVDWDAELEGIKKLIGYEQGSTNVPTTGNAETAKNANEYEMQVSILCENGRYYCLAGETLDKSKTKFGDLALTTEALATPALRQKIAEKYNLFEEEIEKVDPTVYAILKKLECYNSKAADRYIESIRTGRRDANISIAYDLEGLDAIGQDEIPLDLKLYLSGYKSVVEDIGYETSDSLTNVQRLKKRGDLDAEFTVLLEDSKKEYIYRQIVEVKGKSEEGLDTNEAKRQAVAGKMFDMANKRGINLPNGITPERVLIAVAKYEISQAENSPGYLIPEKIADITQASGGNASSRKLTPEEIANPDTIDRSGQR